MSTTSAAGDGRPTSKASQWPIQKPVKGSGNRITSFVRPSSSSAAALDTCVGASGFVPASGHGGGAADLRLGGGEKEGPNCCYLLSYEVFSAFTRDLCVVFYFMGSFVKECTSTAWN